MCGRSIEAQIGVIVEIGRRWRGSSDGRAERARTPSCASRLAPPERRTRRDCLRGTLVAVETLGSRQVYADRWMAVREDTVRRDDRSEGIYTVVDSPDIALVIPADDDRFHLVEQYRHPVGARRWEFPSGTADQGRDSDAKKVAARELREETGLTAGRLTALGTLDVAPGMLSHRCHVFLATELAAGPPHREVEEQDMRSAWFTRAEMEQMMASGTLVDAKSMAAYALLLLRAPAVPVAARHAGAYPKEPGHPGWSSRSRQVVRDPPRGQASLR